MRWTLLLLLCLVAIMLWRPRVGEAPRGEIVAGAATSASAAATPAPAPSLRIEHQLVEVPAVSPAVRSKPRPAARQARLARPAPSSQKLAGSTRRLLFGDGTYRPEPFPRPTRN